MRKALLFLLLTTQVSSLFAQQDAPVSPATTDSSSEHNDLLYLFRAIPRPYLFQPIPASRQADSRPLAQLFKDGSIYLSAHDAVMLALENNLDIASARLLAPIAESDVRRASAGQLLRNVPSAIANGPPGASGPLAGAGASGYEGQAGSQSMLLSGLSIQLAGSPLPQLDPTFYATGSYAHTDRPEANRIVAGTNELISQTQQWQAGLQKGFLTGTSFDLNFNSLRLSQNAPNDTINPSYAADVSFKLTQPLLQGASIKANTRAIRIANADRTVSELTFREQVSVTIAQVLTLYYDLVTFRDELKVIQSALSENRKLLAENQKRLEMGVISQSDLIDSQAAVTEDEREEIDATIQIQQQELTLKSVLTRKGLEDPVIVAAPLIPTDHFNLPEADVADEPIESIATRALKQEFEMQKGELEIANARLGLIGTREALKPVLNLYMNLQSNALSGRLNPLAPVAVGGGVPSGILGGFGNALTEIGKGAYPDYEFGFQLQLPLTNRAAQADMMRDQIDLQQQEMSVQKTRNAVRLQAMRGGLALRQARQQYKAAVGFREMRQKSLTQGQKMFDLGTTSVGRLVDAQRQLELAEQQEITAYNTYARAVINLDSILDETLERNHVVLEKDPAWASFEHRGQ